MTRLAYVVGGVVAVCGAFWLGVIVLTKIARRWGVDPTPMGRTLPKFGKLSAADADAVRKASDQRQHDARERHNEGNQIESGEPPKDAYFRMVNRR